MARQRVRAKHSQAETNSAGIAEAIDKKDLVDPLPGNAQIQRPVGAAIEFVLMLILVAYACFLVDVFQQRVPQPLSAEEAGIRGFSEAIAREHVVALTQFGPHPVGSAALERAFEYVYSELTTISETADSYVNIEVDVHEPNPGLLRMSGGLFYGKSLVYTNLKHLVVRISPADFPESRNNAILISSHIDTVISSPGAGDCSSCVSVMLELVRALSHWASGIKHSIIFLFNTGEEEGLIGAHSFMTQHHWNVTVRAAIDLESMGVGGRPLLFQAGPDKWLLELYASVAKFPTGQIFAQDVFLSNIVKSGTDFQVYREVVGLSGLDFAFMENGAVYHTKNDKIEHLRPGSLQLIGDDLLALLKAAALSDELEFQRRNLPSKKLEMTYFDVLGKWMVAYPTTSAKTFQTHLIIEGLLLLFGSLYIAGYSGFVGFGLGIVTMAFTWFFAVASVMLVATILPLLSDFPTPYIAHPWLVVGLFVAPAIFGALLGNALGRSILKNFLLKNGHTEEHANWHSERCLFKVGIFQWIVLLVLGTWFEVGSSYITLSWILPPALAYAFLEAQFSPRQRLASLQRVTLWLSMAIGIVISAKAIILLPAVLIGNLVRFDRNPGGMPLWSGNALVGVLVASYVCLMLVYMFPYAHRSGGLVWILVILSTIWFCSLVVVSKQIFPAFTEHIGRGVQAVHVIDTTGLKRGHPEHYISLSSFTSGNFEKEMAILKDRNFVCDKTFIDFVSYNVKFGCKKNLEENKHLYTRHPTLDVESDKFIDGQRITVIILNSGSSYRWNLGVNTVAVQAFTLAAFSEKGEGVLVPGGTIVGVDGLHNVQFTTTSNGPTNFRITLFWHPIQEEGSTIKWENETLLKLRTDVNFVSNEVDDVLQKLPEWCVLFGKSTSPYTLAYLADLKSPKIDS